MCSCCGHPQIWSNVHVVEAVSLLKGCVVGRTVETVKQDLTAALLERPEVYTIPTIHCNGQ